MKKLYTLLSLVSISAVAQPTFSTYPTVVNGSVSAGKTIDYTGTDPATVSGSNKTWDYSSLIFNTTENTTTAYTNMSASTHSSSFPTANLFITDESGSETFMNVTSTIQTDLGIYFSDLEATQTFSDPLVHTLPFAYNDTQSDNYVGSLTVDGFTTNITGSYTTTYDGYGTLITPLGSFTNIARWKSVQDETQITDYGIATYVYRFVTTSYSWNYPNDANSVFVIDNNKNYNNGVFDSESETTLAHLNTRIVTGVSNTSRALSALVYPQPAKNAVNMSAPELLGACNATIYSIGGESVLTLEGEAGADHVLNINISSLQKGMYVLEVNNNDQLFRSKLIVN
ncbi:MAG: Por secretion system C-terminal sorting domain containing protein [Cytophagaceae bacterium]|jgi:hypothetical protein|nr:Por secretion system C-terminal sorting domain containing protein [Cytophagaceae bacterium]